MLDMTKYKFYVTKNTVIAVSTYAGKTVRGVAKCDPRDKFDIEAGKKLAAARCNERVAGKRLRRAHKCYEEAQRKYRDSEQHFYRMARYVEDATVAAKEAIAIEAEIVNNL